MPGRLFPNRDIVHKACKFIIEQFETQHWRRQQFRTAPRVSLALTDRICISLLFAKACPRWLNHVAVCREQTVKARVQDGL